MKKIGLFILTFFLSIVSVSAANNYGLEAKYVSGNASSGEVYNLVFNSSEEGLINHLEGRLKLTNLEITSIELKNGFTGDFNKATGEYNLTSKQEFNKKNGEVVWATVTVRYTTGGITNCRLSLESSKVSKYNVNYFTIKTDVYQNNSKVSSIKKGDVFEYRFTISGVDNYFETSAVKFYTTIASNLEILSIDDIQVSANYNHNIERNLQTFTKGNATKTVTVRVRANEDVKGKIENKAWIVVSDKTYEVSHNLVVADSDITVIKEASLNKVTAGSNFKYTITVKNNGNLASKKVILKDALDTNLEFISASMKNTINKNTLTFDLGTFAPYEIKTITIEVKVKENISGNVKKINNIVTAREEGKEDKQSLVSVEVIPKELVDKESNITIKKLSDNNDAVIGEYYTYKIEVKNANSVQLKNITVVDAIPEEFDLVDYEGATLENNLLTWKFDLGANETKVLVVKVKVRDTANEGKHTSKAKLIYEGVEKESNDFTVVISEVENPKTGLVGGSILLILLGALVLNKSRIKNKMLKI